MVHNMNETDRMMDFYTYFASPVYITERPEFIKDVNIVANEYTHKFLKDNEVNEICPMIQTENFSGDIRITDFQNFISDCSLSILDSQGYYMEDKEINLGDMWLHVHYKTSSMEKHTHGFSSQLTGFYFLECPENSSRIILHDPRSGKNQVELPEKNVNDVTLASHMINFEPKPGMLFIAPSWLPHSFTRNASEEPVKFIHFNVYTYFSNKRQCEMPEII